MRQLQKVLKTEKKIYCTKKCRDKSTKIESYLLNAQTKLTKCENRIVEVNKIYEAKMNKLQEQLDYFNKTEEEKREKYQANYNRLYDAYLFKTNNK